MEKETEKEIDISGIFGGIKRFFSTIFNGIGRGLLGTVYFIRKYRKIIGSMMALGIAAGLVYSLAGRPFYSSMMVVKSNDRVLEKNVIIKILDELNLMCDEEDFEELSKILNISVEQAKTLRKFEFEEEVELTNLSDYYTKYFSMLSAVPDEEKQKELLGIFMRSERDNIYYISAAVYDPAVLPMLSEPLEKLMNSNPYFEKRRNINDEAFKSSEQKISSELIKLDSLKLTLTRAIENSNKDLKSGSNNIVLGENQLYNPLPVYEKYISMYSDAIEIKKKIFYNEHTLEIISGFVKLKKNVRLHPALSALLGAATGLLGAIVLILLFLAGDKFNKLEVAGQEKKLPGNSPA